MPARPVPFLPRYFRIHRRIADLYPFGYRKHLPAITFTLLAIEDKVNFFVPAGYSSRDPFYYG